VNGKILEELVEHLGARSIKFLNEHEALVETPYTTSRVRFYRALHRGDVNWTFRVVVQ
jgi:hypothetical protein